jgi:uncharacterized protein YndB with AHSA1/START domain
MPILHQTIDIDASPSEVWRILTNPELVREWAAAYGEGASIRTNWREGQPLTWKTGDGRVRACGTVAAFKPEKLLKIDYPADLDSGSLAPAMAFSDSFEISAFDHKTRLKMTIGPLAPAAAKALKDQAHHAICEIKSLAEELAQIHGLR